MRSLESEYSSFDTPPLSHFARGTPSPLFPSIGGILYDHLFNAADYKLVIDGACNFRNSRYS